MKKLVNTILVIAVLAGGCSESSDHQHIDGDNGDNIEIVDQIGCAGGIGGAENQIEKDGLTEENPLRIKSSAVCDDWLYSYRYIPSMPPIGGAGGMGGSI